MIDRFKRVAIRGHTAPNQSLNNPVAEFAAVSPGYFRVLGTRLLCGRFLTEADDARALPASLIDEDMARRFWPGRTPVGRRIHTDERGRMLRGAGWLTIAGMVENVKTRGLDLQNSPHV